MNAPSIIRRIMGLALLFLILWPIFSGISHASGETTLGQSLDVMSKNFREITWSEFGINFLSVMWFFGSAFYGVMLLFTGRSLTAAGLFVSAIIVVVGVLILKDDIHSFAQFVRLGPALVAAGPVGYAILAAPVVTALDAFLYLFFDRPGSF